MFKHIKHHSHCPPVKCHVDLPLAGMWGCHHVFKGSSFISMSFLFLHLRIFETNFIEPVVDEQGEQMLLFHLR